MVGPVPVGLTVRVKFWVAGLPTPLVAVKVIGKPASGRRGAGQDAAAEGHAGGQGPGLGDGRRRDPVAVTVKVPAVPW